MKRVDGMKRLRSKTNAKILGEGRFASGLRDLASNKRHLEGYGRSKPVRKA